MREIKFRGKRIDNGEWVYGSLLLDFFDDTWIVNTEQPIKEANTQNVWFKVDPVTVGQYTGLHDEKGVEVWEGDIVQPYNNGLKCALHEIRYIDKGFCMAWSPEDTEMDCVWWYVYKVIGNIHDNPELLEEV